MCVEAFNLAESEAGLAQLAAGWTAEGSEFYPSKGKAFSRLHVVQTGSGAHSASHPMGYPVRELFLSVKRPEYEVDHLAQIRSEVNNTCNYKSTLLYTVMAWCLISYAQRQICLLWNRLLSNWPLPS
jgi:hypothetical protein